MLREEKVKESIERFSRLKKETILRYTDEIDFDYTISLYDVMIKHFADGDLDDAFETSVTEGMDKKEKQELLSLVREFQGLCFCNGDPKQWMHSLENMSYNDYDLITYSIIESYNFLLDLAKQGGRDVLKQLVELRACEELRNLAIVETLRTSFVDDRALAAVLLEMVDEKSFYSIFTDEQKGILLTYPEGTLYSYSSDEIKITPPLVLGTQIYNTAVLDDYIYSVDDNNVDSVVVTLSESFRDGSVDFYEESLVLADKYRDYVRQKNIFIDSENPDVVFDTEGDQIQDAWRKGDAMLGGSYENPYTRVVK